MAAIVPIASELRFRPRNGKHAAGAALCLAGIARQKPRRIDSGAFAMGTSGRQFQRRWRSAAAIGVFIALTVISLLTTGMVVTVPFSFLITALLAWDFGLAASLTWLVAARCLVPAVLFLSGTGAYHLVPQARGAWLTLLVSSLLVETALTLLIVRLKTVNGDLQQSKQSLETANVELQSALDEVKELRGFLPICAWCKNVRDVSGNWEQIESYVSRHSRATFTHGVCPKCLEEQMQQIDTSV